MSVFIFFLLILCLNIISHCDANSITFGCDSSPCTRGGTCSDGNTTSFTCTCPFGLTGLYCEQAQLLSSVFPSLQTYSLRKSAFSDDNRLIKVKGSRNPYSTNDLIFISNHNRLGKFELANKYYYFNVKYGKVMVFYAGFSKYSGDNVWAKNKMGGDLPNYIFFISVGYFLTSRITYEADDWRFNRNIPYNTVFESARFDDPYLPSNVTSMFSVIENNLCTSEAEYPCKNGATCHNLGHGSYYCECVFGRTGPSCSERLTLADYTINNGTSGLNYTGLVPSDLNGSPYIIKYDNHTWFFHKYTQNWYVGVPAFHKTKATAGVPREANYYFTLLQQYYRWGFTKQFYADNSIPSSSLRYWRLDLGLNAEMSQLGFLDRYFYRLPTRYTYNSTIGKKVPTSQYNHTTFQFIASTAYSKISVPNIDACNSNPCLHHGTCNTLVFDYTCTCPFGWNGDRCDTRLKLDTFSSYANLTRSDIYESGTIIEIASTLFMYNYTAQSWFYTSYLIISGKYYFVPYMLYYDDNSFSTLADFNAITNQNITNISQAPNFNYF